MDIKKDKEYQECSGDITSCPENEGYGCNPRCQPPIHNDYVADGCEKFPEEKSND